MCGARTSINLLLSDVTQAVAIAISISDEDLKCQAEEIKQEVRNNIEMQQIIIDNGGVPDDMLYLEGEDEMGLYFDEDEEGVNRADSKTGVLGMASAALASMRLRTLSKVGIEDKRGSDRNLGSERNLVDGRRGSARNLVESRRGSARNVVESRRGSARNVVESRRGSARNVVESRRGSARHLVGSRRGSASNLVESRRGSTCSVTESRSRRGSACSVTESRSRRGSILSRRGSTASRRGSLNERAGSLSINTNLSKSLSPVNVRDGTDWQYER